jgi:mono/diheme cytochrome c family protein
MENPAVMLSAVRCAVLAFAVVVASDAPAFDCNPVQFVQKSAVVQYSAVQYAAPIYQAQTLYLVGAPYRAQSLASHAEAAASDAADARLLRRFQAFLQAEATLAEEFKVTGGVLANRCAKCHTAESPGGGIVLDGTEALTADQKNAVMRSVLSGEMPKDLEPLAAGERDELAKLLFLGDW